jgi:hypothetical protein
MSFIKRGDGKILSVVETTEELDQKARKLSSTKSSSKEKDSSSEDDEDTSEK